MPIWIIDADADRWCRHWSLVIDNDADHWCCSCSMMLMLLIDCWCWFHWLAHRLALPLNESVCQADCVPNWWSCWCSLLILPLIIDADADADHRCWSLMLMLMLIFYADDDYWCWSSSLMLMLIIFWCWSFTLAHTLDGLVRAAPCGSLATIGSRLLLLDDLTMHSWWYNNWWALSDSSHSLIETLSLPFCHRSWSHNTTLLLVRGFYPSH